MRAFGWTISSLLFLPAMLFAQVISPPTMPGTPVSTSSVQPVGTRLPSVGTRLPSVGYPLPGYGDKPGTGGTPFQGNFPKVDPDLVVAPFPTEAKQEDFWDKLLKRWDIAFAGEKNPIPPYTPGIARRNRERVKERERQEMLRRMRS